MGTQRILPNDYMIDWASLLRPTDRPASSNAELPVLLACGPHENRETLITYSK